MRQTISILMICLAAALAVACGRLDVAIVTPTPDPGPDVISSGATAGPGQREQGAPQARPGSPELPGAVTTGVTADPTGQPSSGQSNEQSADANGASEHSGEGQAVCIARTDWPLYTVRSGDTLFRIAHVAGATVDELAKANCLDDPDRLLSGQALRVPQIPPDAPGPTTTPQPEPWDHYQDDVYQVSFDYPAAWRNVSEELVTRLEGEDGWLQVIGASSPADLDVVAGNEANHKLLPYGTSPVVEPFSLADGRPARLILPADDQPDSANSQAMIIAPYAEPVLVGDYRFNYLMLAADVDHIRDLGATLTLPPSTSKLTIDSFSVSGKDLPGGGKRLTFRWQARGANRGIITSGATMRFPTWWAVESAGELTVDVPGTLYPDPVMTLRMVNDVSGQQATASTILSWACEDDYFFEPGPAICPRDAALVVDGAFQPFERGFMIWLPRPDLAEPSIYVFTDDGRESLYADTWTEGDPANTLGETPPDGLLEPVGGFAKVWREHPSVRQDLGWGTDAEWLYRVSYQVEAREWLPGVSYLTRPDGSIVRVLDSIWYEYAPGEDHPGAGRGPLP